MPSPLERCNILKYKLQEKEILPGVSTAFILLIVSVQAYLYLVNIYNKYKNPNSQLKTLKTDVQIHG